jgi:hypothetical protein
MIDALCEIAKRGIGWAGGLAGIALFVVSVILFNAVLMILVIALPVDYFCRGREKRNPQAGGRTLLSWCAVVGKNAVGGLLIPAGIILMLPGVPGPGLLLLVIGVSLLDFPGKRRLQYKLLSKPRVHRSINAIRLRFGRPPLILDEPQIQ